MVQRAWSSSPEGEGWPANKGRSLNIVLMLGQRLRRWPNIKTSLGQYLIFLGWLNYVQSTWFVQN